jgi:hypothetical protein
MIAKSGSPLRTAGGNEKGQPSGCPFGSQDDDQIDASAALKAALGRITASVLTGSG